MNSQALSVAALRTAVNRLLDAVEEQLGEQVTFDVDYYWNVPLDEAFNPYESPVLDMGQVSDDVDSVDRFSATTDDVVAIWHESNHLAGVLRAIAARTLP